MKKLNLILHCGASSCTSEELTAAKTPAPDGMHYPVPHGEVLGQLRNYFEKSNLEVVSEAQGMMRGGAQAFGMLQIGDGEGWNDDDDFGLVVGWRNSHDKSFSASLALGNGVFVCDNLAFSGEVKLARKHTLHCERDLPGLVARAVNKLMGRKVTQEQRIACYKQMELSDPDANDFLVRSIVAGVLPLSSLMPTLKQWDRPLHDFGPKTGWRLFNAVTEVLKHRAPLANLKRTQKLHGLMDAQCDALGQLIAV